MRTLAETYATCRAAYPGDRALVVVDIDGTLLDDAQRPLRGVVEIVRWFDMQPLTRVAVNTGRPEESRAETRRLLDMLGAEYRLNFGDDLLHMRPAGSDVGIAAAKADGLRHWQAEGWRIVTVIDSEPEIIHALTATDGLSDVLLLPSAALHRARRAPSHRAPADAGEVPSHVELVWHGVNDRVQLQQFLASPIHWGEVDLRCDPDRRLVLRHDSFRSPRGGGPASAGPTPHDVFDGFRASGKGLKLDIKDDSALADALAMVTELDFDRNDIWVNARVDELGEEGVRGVEAMLPGARLQCPIDFLGPLVVALPDEAYRTLAVLREWGVDRFSVAWTHPHVRQILDRLDDWGLELNLYAVTDLVQYLAAALAVPHSITADFALPEWHYFGRGAGNDGQFHRDRRDAAATEPGVDIPSAESL